MSSQLILIVLLVAGIGIMIGIGWRAPDRSPGIEDEADRERND